MKLVLLLGEDHGWISFYDGQASLGTRQKKWGPMDRWVGCEYLHRPRQICTALVGGAYGLHGDGACRRRLALVLPLGDPLHIPQLRRGTRTAGTFSRRPQPPRTPGRGGARGAGSSGYGGAPNHTDRKYCAEGTHGD